MAKTVKIGGGKSTDKSLVVDIGGKTYSVPMAGGMKRKELAGLKTEEDVFNMFARYIPAEVLDDLTLDEYSQLMDAWVDANEKEQATGLGES